MIISFLIKIALAIGLGGIVGFERERRQKPAGLRSIMLITLACTLFTVISTFPLASFGGGDTLARIDPGRIASNILTGLGFIGAGVIIQAHGSVKGITTAAVIWCSGALGMLIGFGYYLFAVFFTVAVFIITDIIGKIEGKLESKLDKK